MGPAASLGTDIVKRLIGGKSVPDGLAESAPRHLRSRAYSLTSGFVGLLDPMQMRFAGTDETPHAGVEVVGIVALEFTYCFKLKQYVI